MAKREKKAKILTRRKREFSYKGLKMEELLKMSLHDLINILPARARRSLKRGFTPEQEKFLMALRSGKAVVETHNRDMIILPEFVGRKIGVHRGNEFRVIEIIPDMIGHYLGEFAMTRRFVKHAGPGVGATKSSKFMPLK